MDRETRDLAFNTEYIDLMIKIQDIEPKIKEINVKLSNIRTGSLKPFFTKPDPKGMQKVLDEIELLMKESATMEANLAKWKVRLNEIDPQKGGAIQKKSLKRTDEKKLVKGYNRVIYLGKQNKKYVQIKGAFVPLSSIK